MTDSQYVFPIDISTASLLLAPPSDHKFMICLTLRFAGKFTDWSKSRDNIQAPIGITFKRIANKYKWALGPSRELSSFVRNDFGDCSRDTSYDSWSYC